MENFKNESISLLNELLSTYNQARQYAEYKLKYITPNCPMGISQYNEFSKMRDRAEFNISKVSGCITWLSKIDVSQQNV